VLQTKQRSVTLPTYINSTEGIAAAAKQLLQPELPITIRLLGLRVSNLQQASHALPGSLVNFLRKGLKSGADGSAFDAVDNCPQHSDEVQGDSGACELHREDVMAAGAQSPEHGQHSGEPDAGSDEPVEPGMQVCTECGARIATENMQEHSDMHVAQRVSAIVNGAGYIEPSHRRIDAVDRGVRPQEKSGSKRGGLELASKKSRKKRSTEQSVTLGALDRLLIKRL
jgi:hypothetical protein